MKKSGLKIREIGGPRNKGASPIYSLDIIYLTFNVSFLDKFVNNRIGLVYFDSWRINRAVCMTFAEHFSHHYSVSAP
jgi:hypothetical protein